MQFDQDKGAVEVAKEEAQKIHWYDFWKHGSFWTRYCPTMLTGVLVILGICLYVWQRNFRVAYFGVAFRAYPRPKQLRAAVKFNTAVDVQDSKYQRV